MNDERELEEQFKELFALASWDEIRAALNWLISRMLVAANLAALAGVLFAGWSVGFLMICYWAETLVIGAYTILKMFVAARGEYFEWIVMTLIFILHFGTFMAGHGAFVGLLVAFLQIPMSANPTMEQIVEIVLALLADPWFKVAIAVMLVSHGVSFVQHVICRRELEPRSVSDVMMDPYRRVMVMQLMIFLGAALIMFIGASKPFAIALVLLKTVADIGAHAKEHEQEELTHIQYPGGRT